MSRANFSSVALALLLALAVPTAVSAEGRGGDAEISGVVWHDLDHDGFRDGTEPGLAGVTVQMRDTADDSIVETMVTDSLGQFDSSGSPAITAVAEIVLPPGLILTLQDVPVAEEFDSDFDRSTRRSPTFSSPRSFDAGLGAPELVGLGLDVDFEVIAAGESLTVAVEIPNGETFPVTLTDFFVGGQFALDPGTCGPLPFTLASGASCTVEVTATSPGAGSTSGSSWSVRTEWNLGYENLGWHEVSGTNPLYVDLSAPPGGTGSSWGDPYSTVEEALAAAAFDDDVWITGGVVRPSSTLVVPSGVGLAGSFSGGEVGTLQRDLSAGPTTVVTGDLGDDDDDPDADDVIADADDIVGTNLARLVEATTSGQLDGLVLTAADGDSPGVALSAGSRISLGQVVVTGHRGPSAVEAGSGPSKIRRSAFVGNDGVALSLQGPEDALVESSVFRANRTAGDGAAVRALETTFDGEGLAIRSSHFSGNRAEGKGGALRFTPASGRGGGPGTLVVERSTFAGNSAGTVGGAISAELTESGNVLRESIFRGNRDDLGNGPETWAIDVGGTFPVPFESSVVEGSGGSASWDGDFGVDLGGNLDVDPQWVAPGSSFDAPSAGGDYRLWASSPLLDLGAVDPPEPLDAALEDRVQGKSADLGAFEGGVAGARGRVWRDLDGDGVQDDGEPGIAGVEVRVLVTSRGAIFVVPTDADGDWQLADLSAHSVWAVEVLLPEGFVFSPRDVGSDETDSDVDPSTGRLDGLDVTTAPTVDAGLVEVLFADDFESGDTSAWSVP